jgi:predicted Holliday junction resolvase-like endonuclease
MILTLLCVFAILLLLVARKIENKKYEETIIGWEEDYNKLLSQKKSSEVRLGQISEQLAPFLQEFKYDPKQSHFLGQPVDYIVFQPDKIVFLEVKSGKAQLNSRQQEIKKLVQAGKIEWDEMRIDGTMPPPITPPSSTGEVTVYTDPTIQKQRMD